MFDFVYVFIDASNVWEAQKAKGKVFDYKKLQNFLLHKYSPKPIKIFYYTAFPEEGTRSYSTQGKHKFYTFLKKNLGFIVRKRC